MTPDGSQAQPADERVAAYVRALTFAGTDLGAIALRLAKDSDYRHRAAEAILRVQADIEAALASSPLPPDRESLIAECKRLADDLMRLAIGLSHGRRSIAETKAAEQALNAAIDRLGRLAAAPPCECAAIGKTLSTEEARRGAWSCKNAAEYLAGTNMVGRCASWCGDRMSCPASDAVDARFVAAMISGDDMDVTPPVAAAPAPPIDVSLRQLRDGLREMRETAEVMLAAAPSNDTVPWPIVTRYSGGASAEGVAGRVWVRLDDNGPEVEYVPAAAPVVPAGETVSRLLAWSVPVELPDGRIAKMRKCDLRDDDRVAFIGNDHPAASAAAPERFFMDHGLWHDRVTGQHLYTEDQYRQGRRDALQEHADRLREAELRTAPLNAAEPVTAPVLTDEQIVAKHMQLVDRFLNASKVSVNAYVEGRAGLRWDADMLVTNPFGERVWLKEKFVDGQRVGITDCCAEASPCDWHAVSSLLEDKLQDAAFELFSQGWNAAVEAQQPEQPQVDLAQSKK